jgi:hypothetical protein
MANEKSHKTRINYNCYSCDYITCNHYDYKKHMTTVKHLRNAKPANYALMANEKSQQIATSYSCVCGKIYKHDSSLCKHKKTCKFVDLQPVKDTSQNSFDKEFMMTVLNENREMVKANQEVMKENNEFKTLIMDLCKDVSTKMVTNVTHTNSHNKSFNLNFFLNEQCKDAMNIMEFVESVKLQLYDLERMGETGYVEGMSNIIVKSLQELDVYKRPIHSSDSKREVIYVKDEDKWEKDDDDKPLLKKAIKHIAHKNTKLLNDYKDKFPGCVLASSQHNDMYNKLVLATFDGTNDNDNRVIKKISKGVIIDKISIEDDTSNQAK